MLSAQRQDNKRIESGAMRSSRVLVVDDEAGIRSLLQEVLGGEGYEVTAAEDGVQAIDLLRRDRFDLIITDMVMPGANGIEVLHAARRIDPHCPVIMITGYPSVDTAVRLINFGAEDCIAKPFNLDLIKMTVAKILERKKVRGEADHRATPSSAPRG